ncbi:MAG: HAMP domain-containing protein [Betaproteobacteria bacterium]|nr:HAMP domain-containing protein [Betaproteobacteria bacterium]
MKFPFAHFGLRAKTFVTLIALSGVTVLFALLLGSLSLHIIRDDLGRSFARSRVLLSQQRILAALLPELALARRFADGVLTHRWVKNERDPATRELFFKEAEGYRKSFADQSYFIAPAGSGNFYLNGRQTPFSKAPRYTLKKDKPEDTWFYHSLKQSEAFNINVETDHVLKTTKVWFNVLVRNETGDVQGVAGTGLDLGEFLDNFIKLSPSGVTAMIIDPQGRIQAHPDPAMIEYSSVGKADAQRTLHQLLNSGAERQTLADALSTLLKGQEQAVVFNAHLSGKPHLIALAYIPEVRWYVLSAVDLDVHRLFDNNLVQWAVVAGALAILALIALTMVGFDRLVLSPLARLTRSVRQVAEGGYGVRLRSTRRDELGELARTFDLMAEHVHDHTTHLEEWVHERTEAVREAHNKLDAAHRLLTDSIASASLFQRALLPNKRALEYFPGEIFALWLPRDVVGGDLYLYRQTERGCLIALMDCVGHGVPGAFMTMIAHAALDLTLNERGLDDPAALLLRFDENLRTMLPERERFGQLSTDMDMALCHLDFAARRLTFAGARVALRWIDAEGYHCAPAGKRNIGGSRRGWFSNVAVALAAGRTFYLTTDGLLDQNGVAQGFALGESNFEKCLVANAHLSLPEQQAALNDFLAVWRGDLPQRDDVAVIGFRIDGTGVAPDPHS